MISGSNLTSWGIEIPFDEKELKNDNNDQRPFRITSKGKVYGGIAWNSDSCEPWIEQALWPPISLGGLLWSKKYWRWLNQCQYDEDVNWSWK
jgi:hypothetical protein